MSRMLELHTDLVAVDQGPSPLMSNNPFRNKLGSQISPQPSPRPLSTNPFLDATEINAMAAQDNGTTDARPGKGDPAARVGDAFVSPFRLDKTKKKATC